MHYYQFNIGDYSSHTKGLSLLEDLAYRRLIDEYYLSERPLNGRSTDVARRIGMRKHEEEVEYVLARFFREVDSEWRHERIDNDIASFVDKKKKASAAGKASAKKRAKTISSKTEPTDVEQTFNRRSTNHKPITINQEPNKNNTSKFFDEFWNNYPKKVDKKKARVIWKRQNLDQKAKVIILDIKNRIVNDGKWAEGYIPNPTTYLNGDRWEDEVQPREKNQQFSKPTMSDYMEQNERAAKQWLDSLERGSSEADDQSLDGIIIDV